MTEEEYQKRLLIETVNLRAQNAEFLQQRNTARQLTIKLAEHIRLVRDRGIGAARYPAELMAQVDLTRGISAYERPV